jgi:hypothetical protein
MSINFDRSQIANVKRGRIPVGSVVEIDSSLDLVKLGNGTVWLRSGVTSAGEYTEVGLAAYVTGNTGLPLYVRVE